VTISDTPPVTKIVADGSNITSVTATNCAAATIFDNTNQDLISKVIDTRESLDKYYAIAKMPDKKCWMLNNLAYGGTIAGTQVTTSNGVSAWNTTVTNKYWDNAADNNLLYASGGNTTPCTVAYNTNTAINYAVCGYVYNWCAAMGSNAATIGCGRTDNSDTDYTSAGLCPSGWRLPTRQEYVTLWTSSAPNGLANTINNIVGPSSVWRGVYSGYFYPGYGLYNQGAYGYYWSATTVSSYVYSYNPLFGSGGSVYTANYTNRYVGFAVRCVIGSGT
jgi:uncharacterized protein (TIGR02145 family)